MYTTFRDSSLLPLQIITCHCPEIIKSTKVDFGSECVNTLIADKIYIFNNSTVRLFIISRLMVIVEIKAGIL